MTAKAPDAVPQIEALVAAYKARPQAGDRCVRPPARMLANAGVDMRRRSFRRRVRPQPRILHRLRVRGAGAASRAQSPVAGGGRYDSLLRGRRRPAEVPAVGSCIHTERLLAAVREQAHDHDPDCSDKHRYRISFSPFPRRDG